MDRSTLIAILVLPELFLLGVLAGFAYVKFDEKQLQGQVIEVLQPGRASLYKTMGVGAFALDDWRLMDQDRRSKLLTVGKGQNISLWVRWKQVHEPNGTYVLAFRLFRDQITVGTLPLVPTGSKHLDNSTFESTFSLEVPDIDEGQYHYLIIWLNEQTKEVIYGSPLGTNGWIIIEEHLEPCGLVISSIENWDKAARIGLVKDEYLEAVNGIAVQPSVQLNKTMQSIAKIIGSDDTIELTTSEKTYRIEGYDSNQSLARNLGVHFQTVMCQFNATR